MGRRSHPMPAWEIYFKELLSRGNGHAVWEADPGARPAVDIGAVGYMENGAFIQLFNASKEIGDVSNKLGTPDGHKPFHVGEIQEGTLSSSLPITSDTVLQRKVGVNLSGGPIVQSGGGFVFECTKEQGAVLILGEDADRRDALQKLSFTRCILENHSAWLKFANDVHERGVSLDQLLLVTGCDKTSAWACAAFSATSKQLGFEFNVGNPAVAQGGISVWGSWNSCQSVQVHSGPRIRQSQSSDSQSRAKELEAADILSPEKRQENGISSAVNSVSQATAMCDVVQLAYGAKVEQEARNSSQERECYAAISMGLHDMIRSHIVLCSWVLGRMLLCIFSYVFSIVSGNALSDPIQPFRVLLSEIVERTHGAPKFPPHTNNTHASRNQISEDNTVPSPTTALKVPLSPSRNQCVFVRGFKLCDRSTMKKRIRHLGRKKPPPEDGFTYLDQSKRDDKDGPGRSRGSSSNGSSYSFWDREGTSGYSGSTGEDRSTGSSSQSQSGSQYSLGPSITTSEADSVSIYDTVSDHEFALYQQCHELKQPTHLDILMEYILENSPAELALVHHDDLATMPEHVGSMSAFESELCQRAPAIYIENGIGMLEATFKASQDSKLPNEVTRPFASKTKNRAPPREENCLSGTKFGSINEKMESVLSLVRTDLASARIEKMMMPWVFQTYKKRCVYACSALRPSYSSPRMVIPGTVFLDDRQSISGDGGGVKERTMSQFATLERWKPTETRHMISIPAGTGPYFEISNRYVTEWVNAQSHNDALAALEPPSADVETISCHFVSSCFNGEKGFTAISFVLSDCTPRIGHSNLGTSSKISSKKSFSFFSSSTWNPGRGTGNALKWLREKVTSAMGHTAIMTRSQRYISLLRKWERGKKQVLGFEERFMVLAMLQDALEISRECYPARLNRAAYKIGRQVQRWLQSCSLIPQTSETTQWLIQVHVCLMSLLLSRISRLDPTMTNLAHDVLSNLTRIPISLHGRSTPAAVICLVVNELSYSQDKFQHSWLGVWLARIVELSLKVRRLTDQEVKALGTLAMRRKEDQSVVCSVKCCRPWEVALFSQIATQETWFKPVVLDIHGLPSLVNALDCMLASNINRHAVHWNRVALTLRAMSFSLEQEWVASIVKPRIILSLLRVFRRSIPEKWFCIRFWAADAIRNVVAHQPSLVQVLLKENAVAAIETLAAPKLDRGHGDSAPVNRRVNEVKTSVQNRLFEEYKREGLKRAAELVVYVEQWTPDSLSNSKLEAVTPGWSGYLGGAEESSN